MEIWKKVLGGAYEVSSLGNVRSCDRVGADGRRWRGQPIKLTCNQSHGTYYFFNASVDGRSMMRRVHILVAEAFLGKRPSGMEVNHKNGNSLHNHASNLEYKTRKKNAEHAVEHGLMPTKANGRWRRVWRPANLPGRR